MVPEIEHLSHKVNREGSDSEVAAIVEALPPENVLELKFFFGMVNYYGKFLSNLFTTTLVSLYQLLRKETPWQWGDKE
jgi:hypothetical protein